MITIKERSISQDDHEEADRMTAILSSKDAELAAKARENRKLYKLVNGLKDRITNLEIAIADREVQIEDLKTGAEN